MFDRIVRILLSRKASVYLLIIMVAFLILGTSLPDITAMSPEEALTFSSTRPLLYKVSDALQMQNLISSPSFLILPGLIFLSTLLCTVKRLRKRKGKEGGFFTDSSGPAALGLDEIGSVLMSKRWRITREETSMKANKGGFGFWGSMLFHVGLLIVFTAVVVSSLTRFSAELLLTEGFPVRLGREALVKIYKSKGILEIPPSVIELKKFIPSYEHDRFARDFAAEVQVDGTRRDVRVNQPIEIGDFQLSLHRFGFSPSFRITDDKGRELLNATINLVVMGGKEDSFAIPGTPHVVYTTFFPDFFVENKRPVSRGTIPRNPVFLLRVVSQGRELGKGMVPLGKSVMIDNLNISFEDLNYWADFIVGRDYGLWVFVIGFGLGILGLALRFMLPDKQIEIEIEGNKVQIKGWSKYFPSFFEEEVREIVEKIGEGKLN